MSKYQPANISFIPKQFLNRHASQVVPIHNGDIYGNIPINPKHSVDHQTQRPSKPWITTNKNQQQRPLSSLSSEHIDFSSDERPKHTTHPKAVNKKYQYSNILKIFWATVITLLTVAALSIAIYELIVTNMRMTTTTSTTTTTTTTMIANLSQCDVYLTIDDGTRLAIAPGNLFNDVNSFSGVYTWCRFNGASGTRIVTSPPASNRCGGSYSGWYAGNMPTYGHTVNGTACYVGSNACNYINTILVTNCGPYYVYALIDPPINYGRYCTE